MNNVLAVHGGASMRLSPDSIRSCSKAARERTVIDAVKVLELDDNFNCGFGANLSYEGTVECEASYMSSKGEKFGAVGCVSRIRHVSALAELLANDDWWKRRKLVHPMVLVGSGSESYAVSKGIDLICPTELVSLRAKEQHSKALKLLEKNSLNFEESALDTVGAVSISLDDISAEACTSSGGMLMKHCGRLGHSCIYGSATWTETVDVEVDGELVRRTVGMSSTGHGEALIRTDFCRSLSKLLLANSDALHVDIAKDFIDPKFSDSNKSSYGYFGGIAMIAEKSNCEDDVARCELLVFHNTPFLPVAFRNCRGKIKKLESTVSPHCSFTIDSFLL